MNSGLERTEIITDHFERAMDLAMLMAGRLEDRYEWVAISDAYPVMIHGVLNYTITVTAGTLV